MEARHPLHEAPSRRPVRGGGSAVPGVELIGQTRQRTAEDLMPPHTYTQRLCIFPDARSWSTAFSRRRRAEHPHPPRDGHCPVFGVPLLWLALILYALTTLLWSICCECRSAGHILLPRLPSSWYRSVPRRSLVRGFRWPPPWVRR